jgi:ribosomal protein S18 acetylase RimI-like enzyme
VAEINIRNFSFPQDYKPVLALWQNAGDGVRLGRSDSLDEIEKKLLRDPDLFLLAEDQGRIVGSVIGGFDGRRGLVYHLAVSLGCRQKGLGDRLMRELEDRLRAKGCLRVYLLVTKDNLGAIRFYEKRGWGKMDLHIYAKDIV